MYNYSNISCYFLLTSRRSAADGVFLFIALLSTVLCCTEYSEMLHLVFKSDNNQPRSNVVLSYIFQLKLFSQTEPQTLNPLCRLCTSKELSKIVTHC